MFDHLHFYSTVPSAHDVLVPETLLKKRKSDAKAREEKAAKAAETKKVSISTTNPATFAVAAMGPQARSIVASCINGPNGWSGAVAQGF